MKERKRKEKERGKRKEKKRKKKYLRVVVHFVMNVDDFVDVIGHRHLLFDKVGYLLDFADRLL